ncbi:MAG: DNA polymerase III subunit chi [Burkholderiaceae bacterium]|nr:DNA polymerase III subunit chi [Burkholderiaceae bacterium]
MTRIDFHTNVADRIGYTCRLVRKARAQAADSRIVILTQDQHQLAALDQALWTFSAQDFLPHAEASDPLAAQSPIVLTDSDSGELPHHDMLINLSGATPAHFAQFARMFEIVSTDAADVEDGRKRYAHYRQRGYPLTHNVASQS